MGVEELCRSLGSCQCDSAEQKLSCHMQSSGRGDDTVCCAFRACSVICHVRWKKKAGVTLDVALSVDAQSQALR